jgi:hypothetical protein
VGLIELLCLVRSKPTRLEPAPTSETVSSASIHCLRHALFSRSPPSVLRSGRPLPAPTLARLCLRPACANKQVSFRPRGFSPPRRLPPASQCGLVASHCRSWGSPRCFHPPACASRLRRANQPARLGSFPRCAHPSKILPARSASTTHRDVPEGPRVTSWRCPPAVMRHGTDADSTAQARQRPHPCLLHAALDFGALFH